MNYYNNNSRKIVVPKLQATKDRKKSQHQELESTISFVFHLLSWTGRSEKKKILDSLNDKNKDKGILQGKETNYTYFKLSYLNMDNDLELRSSS